MANYFMRRTLSIFSLLLLSNMALGQNNAVIVKAAKAQIGKTRLYDPAYVTLSYPKGDVPIERGVCSDVVIRALRGSGLDLQQLVHEDMRQNFGQYPKNWGLKSTDRNIDHRRVPNLETFFTRQKKSLPVSQNGRDYQAGDIVSWRLSNGLPHIGIVSDTLNAKKTHRLIVHNISSGAKEEDVLFKWKIIGHYRYY